MTDALPYPGTPRWVKISLIVGLHLVVIVLVILAGGDSGRHGPGRHMQSHEITDDTATPVPKAEPLPHHVLPEGAH